MVHYTDSEAFARRVEAFLTAEEEENNLILGVIAGICAGTYDNARMVAVEDRGEPRLAADMTAPYKLVLSKANEAALQPRGARIGPVYTPPEARGKGYASACVGGLAQRLLDDGKTSCGIFADLANPASNRVYQRLGFQEACRYREYTFEEIQVSPDPS